MDSPESRSDAAKNVELWTETNREHTNDSASVNWALDEITWGVWAIDESEMRVWLATLDEAALDGPCRTESSGPGHPFWFHLQHIYSHGIQQFADAAALLTAAGRSPGELDFLEFVESTDRRA